MTMAPLVHQPAQRDRALGLGEHVAQPRLDQRLADLVLDRGDRLGAEMVAVGGVLALPERPHYGSATWRSTSGTRKASSINRRGSINSVPPGTSSKARTALVRM